MGNMLLVTGSMQMAEVTLAQDHDVTIFRGAPTTEQLIESLTPEQQIESLSREDCLELSQNPDDCFRGLHRVPGAKPKAVALPNVQFEFDSYELSPAAKEILNTLGSALQSNKLGKYDFLIEGHTDIIGGREYNQVLSEKRAQAVKQYLVDKLHIKTQRLSSIGRGEEALLDKQNPTGSINRRVQIVNRE